jgi:hypothetical protein
MIASAPRRRPWGLVGFAAFTAFAAFATVSPALAAVSAAAPATKALLPTRAAAPTRTPAPVKAVQVKAVQVQAVPVKAAVPQRPTANTNGQVGLLGGPARSAGFKSATNSAAIPGAVSGTGLKRRPGAPAH